MDKQPFLRDIVRISKRHAAQTILERSPSPTLANIRASIEDIAPAIESFSKQVNHDLFIVEPEKWKLIQEAFQSVCEANGINVPGLALVILGSNSNGGSLLRRIFRYYSSDSQGTSDLDYGLLADQSSDITKEVRVALQQGLDSYIEDHAHEFAIPDGTQFHLCPSYSTELIGGGTITPIAENLTATTARDLMTRPSTSYLLAIYFLPSIPEQKNDENRQLILQELTQLHQTDPKFWEHQTHSLIDYLKKYFALKEKYFPKTGRERDQKLIAKTQQHSQDTLIENLKTLLLQT